MGTYIPVTPGKIAPLAWLPDPLQATGKLALVCEGGGQRGIFTAGVLDEFLKAGFNPFDLLIGTSAGAQNLSAYLCGQRGYARHVITRYTTDKQFFNPLRFIRGGNLIDLDWLISSTYAECPLNIAHALRRFDQGQEFYMCASRADNLDAAYFSPQAEDWLEYIKASSAIPGFYREGVEIDGITYHDGGISDAVPVIEAWRRGATRIVVIRTVPSQLYYTPEWVKRMERWLEKSHLKRMVAMMKQHAKSYYRTQKFIQSPPPGVEIAEIYPNAPLASNALGSRVKTLMQDYRLGRRSGRYFLATLGERWASYEPVRSSVLRVPPASNDNDSQLPVTDGTAAVLHSPERSPEKPAD